MKKITFVILLSLLILPISCAKKSETDEKISQLRYDALYSSCEEYEIYAFKEIREEPLKDDGETGEKKNVLIFKIIFKKETPLKSSPIVSFGLNGLTYRKEFEYKPLSNFVCCSLFLPSLPDNKLEVAIEFNKTTNRHTLLTVLNKDTLSCSEIIDVFKKTNDADALKFLNGENKYEMRVRLISSEGYNCYFVGLYGESEFVGFLLDGTTGEFLAKKK